MILYIVLYKCVQRRKYINGFSQWGSMHELFFKDDDGGKDTVSVNARFPNLIKSYRSTFNILVFVFSHRNKNISEFPEVTEQMTCTSQCSFTKNESPPSEDVTVKATTVNTHTLAFILFFMGLFTGILQTQQANRKPIVLQ